MSTQILRQSLTAADLKDHLHDIQDNVVAPIHDASLGCIARDQRSVDRTDRDASDPIRLQLGRRALRRFWGQITASPFGLDAWLAPLSEVSDIMRGGMKNSSEVR